MKNILLCLAAVLLVGGCYTQLMTYSYYAGPAVRDSIPGDSGAGAAQSAVGYDGGRYSSGCNCTPYEIQASLCWCVCDRCGRYHRFGYNYCPNSFYSSYWGWDYYNDYPWWHDQYYDYRNSGYYNDYGYPYHHPSSSGGGTPSATLPKADNAPYVGDRKSHRSYITAPPTPAADNPAPKPSVEGPGSAPPPPVQAVPAAPPDTSGKRMERPSNRNRLR